MKTVTLPGGERVPALGLGTWRMGENSAKQGQEIAILRQGLDLGLTLIDTAEMYGEGGAEEVVAKAVAGRRDKVFIVSKVYPHNASRDGVIAACDRSLARLATEAIDLYLLHWRGSYPLTETVEAFERLKRDGKIRYWGVSNFDVSDMAELLALEAGRFCAANQVKYHLGQRGIEWQLLPQMQERAIPVMAYSPLSQGELLRDATLARIARRRGTAAASVGLAWVLRHDGLIAIPKTADPDHLTEIVASLDVTLDDEDLAELDAAFPPPKQPSPLSIS
ncbi:MAG TPA: aldo/keto reductase [Aestuariivirgaceae bacterium]|nr:aldo/keto reductase [Aestuariivirgaceae bacterium]